MTLENSQLERYARHIVLPEIGGAGQQKLLSARVLVIGAGGLGAPLLLYLAAAGVGTIGLVDDDAVSLSNLQRQIIHDTTGIGQPKVTSAQAALKKINPDVTLIPHQTRITYENAIDLVTQFDIVADGSDNFPTRFLVSDACYLARRPLVSAAVGRFEGQLSTFKPYTCDKDGLPYPTYRCLVPDIPPPGSVPACAQAGILGAVTGVIGSLQALEIIKEITGTGQGLAGQLLLYDALDTRFRKVKLRRDPGNPLNGDTPVIVDLSRHQP